MHDQTTRIRSPRRPSHPSSGLGDGGNGEQTHGRAGSMPPGRYRDDLPYGAGLVTPPGEKAAGRDRLGWQRRKTPRLAIRQGGLVDVVLADVCVDDAAGVRR